MAPAVVAYGMRLLVGLALDSLKKRQMHHPRPSGSARCTSGVAKCMTGLWLATCLSRLSCTGRTGCNIGHTGLLAHSSFSRLDGVVSIPEKSLIDFVVKGAGIVGCCALGVSECTGRALGLCHTDRRQRGVDAVLVAGSALLGGPGQRVALRWTAPGVVLVVRRRAGGRSSAGLRAASATLAPEDVLAGLSETCNAGEPRGRNTHVSFTAVAMTGPGATDRGQSINFFDLHVL